jgi:hypothetical protein
MKINPVFIEKNLNILFILFDLTFLKTPYLIKKKVACQDNIENSENMFHCSKEY